MRVLGYCSPRVSIDPLFLVVFALPKHLLTALRSLSAKKRLGFLGSNFKGRARHCQQYGVFLFHSSHLLKI